MSIQIQMLGTGSAFAKRYYNNNAMISTSKQTFLIDCGITAPLAIHQIEQSFNDFEGVLVTHLHADHIGGLEEYAFQMKFLHQRRPKLFIANTLLEPLWEHSLKAGMTQPGIDCIEDVFEVIPIIPAQAHEITPELKVEWMETPHIPGKQSYSLLINDTFFYSADIRFQPDLLQSLVEQGVHTIWHDCQLEGEGEVHATIKELLTLPPSIQSKILLMHYGDTRPEWDGHTGPMPFINQHETYSIRP
ncbi:MBL fold metallo-hydrolase [Paenibacillus aquistagni]|uniref:Ribonuclease BN, tRNA processing enzyme n=1 Tax=Paenibacillus aquistagni TaxID=1852522 RepID=A0A1X7IHV8_9BACL|nr:MBL fold metallo-hydrolase [Paenibacillus aquistagni]SMG14004.1 Ribonuclease BN, tRNA processing enzyme [Paenibacillus aquistagni]